MAARFGGTWEAFAQGFVLVGTDSNEEDFSTIGEYTMSSSGNKLYHTLQDINLPIHTHTVPALTGTAASAGAHEHTINGNRGRLWSDANSSGATYEFVANSQRKSVSNAFYAESNGAHTHSVVASGTTNGCTGCSSPAAPIYTRSPYRTVYMWKRTA